MHVLEEISTDQYFNSQPLKEADPVVRLSVPALRHFNSQPHKEADWAVRRWDNKSYYFNSQPHKEADIFSLQ